MKAKRIREVCGEYAIDLLLDHGGAFTMYFKSKQNALNVKQIIDADNGEPNAADVAPVVHGHWIEKPFLLGTSRFCSLCGNNYGMPHEIYNYCPNCGARMDGRTEQDG